MYKIKDDHDAQHENTIEDVKKRLVALDESVIAIEILDNAENRSDEDKDACDIQRIQHGIPAKPPPSDDLEGF